MSAGRPKKRIDYDVVDKLASIQCTEEEIANVLNISVRTLQRDEEFCRVYKKGLDNGKMSLRRIQFKLAEKNPTMALWLGKQYLGQRDNPIEATDESLNNVKEILVSIKEVANANTDKQETSRIHKKS